MKKRKKRLFSVFMILVMLLTCSFSVYAAPEADSGKGIETEEYLDGEKPRELASLLGLNEEKSRLFGEYGKRYEGGNFWIDYDPDYLAISAATKGNTDISYHGISYGTTLENVNKIMKQEGWYPWRSSGGEALYMKQTSQRWYSFYVKLSGENVTQWEWMNWTQGDFANDVPFSDVPENAWFFDSVFFVQRNWLMTGLDDTNFGPAEDLARAQFAVILHRMEEEPEAAYSAIFPDVPKGQWYTDAVMWANDNGIVTGYSSTGMFGTGDKINREQMAVMMYRYAAYKGYPLNMLGGLDSFRDGAFVSEYARTAMEWAVGTGIITGKGDGHLLDPQGNANRAECATIIMRFCETYGLN